MCCAWEEINGKILGLVRGQTNGFTFTEYFLKLMVAVLQGIQVLELSIGVGDCGGCGKTGDCCLERSNLIAKSMKESRASCSS